MGILTKLFHRLTAYLPRKLPASEAEFAAFKTVLTDAYGVPNEPRSWITVAGQITSTPPQKLRRPWGDIANAAKRLRINEVAQAAANASREVLNAALADATAMHSNAVKTAEAIIVANPERANTALLGDAKAQAELVAEFMEKFPDARTAPVESITQFIMAALLQHNTKRAKESNEAGTEKLPEANGKPNAPASEVSEAQEASSGTA